MDCYPGVIFPFVSSFAPVGFALAAGQLMTIQQNTTLYGVIGTLYGGDDIGSSTFALPNLIGTTMIGAGNQPNGPSGVVVGTPIGNFQATMAPTAMPYHGHNANFTLNRMWPTATVAASAGSGTLIMEVPLVPGADPHGVLEPSAKVYSAMTGLRLVDGGGGEITGTGPYTPHLAAANASVAVTPPNSLDVGTSAPTATVTIPDVVTGGSVTLANAGASAPFSVVQPSLVVNFIICLSTPD